LNTTPRPVLDAVAAKTSHQFPERIECKYETITYALHASGPLADNDTVYLYGPEGLPVEQIDGSGDAVFYHHDQRGSTRAVTDSTGHTVEIVAYDAFGNEAYHSGSVTVPFGFGGAYTDPVSHLVLMGHDYYDPPTGQFLNARGAELASGSMPRRSPQVADPSSLACELMFDHFEEGIKLDPGLGYDSFSDFPVAPWLPTSERRVLTGGYAWGPTGRFADRTPAKCRYWDSQSPGWSECSIGSSPYTLGGGDPINSAISRDKGAVTVLALWH
jgi:uncharacterized protein RhaS with RHS repeats